MASRRRNAAQRELDTTVVVEKVWAGVAQAEIARMLGVSQQQVSRDWQAELDRVRAGRTTLVQDWLDQRLLELERTKTRCLALLEATERGTEVVEFEPTVSPSTGRVRMTKSKVRKLPPKPNPRWMELFLKSIRLECELLGLLKAAAPEAAPATPELPQPKDIKSLAEATEMLKQLGQLGNLGTVLRYDRHRKPSA